MLHYVIFALWSIYEEVHKENFKGTIAKKTCLSSVFSNMVTSEFFPAGLYHISVSSCKNEVLKSSHEGFSTLIKGLIWDQHLSQEGVAVPIGEWVAILSGKMHSKVEAFWVRSPQCLETDPTQSYDLAVWRNQRKWQVFQDMRGPVA